MNKNILYIGILLVGLLTAGCTQTGSDDADILKAQLLSAQSEASSLKSQLASKDAEIAAASAGELAAGPLAAFTVDNIVLEVNDFEFRPGTPVKLVTKKIVLKPGADSGWHIHPGPVMTTVLSGEYTFYDSTKADCGSDSLNKGEGWFKAGVKPHLVANEGDEDLEFIVTFYVPEGEAPKTAVEKPEHCPTL